MNKKEKFQYSLNQCYDYIFEKTFDNQPKSIFFKPGSLQIEDFQSHEECPWPAVSDHKGLAIEILIGQVPKEGV